MNEKIGVSLVNYLCPICAKVADENIVINNILTEKYANEVKELHGKSIGYADHCCEECAKFKDQVLYLIGVDPDKSDFKNIETIYRTGQIVGIKKDAEITKLFEKSIIEWADGTKFCFVEEELGKQFNLW